MSIALFSHNQRAYDAALSMMAETGKAAIIHPTGTGKSFIDFKLADEHPNSKVCWLSPSEYIFRTQIENLKNAENCELDNIEFLTYAKLMVSTRSFMKEIKPDYIVLDEFHRCGAAEWGKGVDRLLAAFPNVPVLGLSATHIRYLDNQRDMAEELFEGNVASEMSLGEESRIVNERFTIIDEVRDCRELFEEFSNTLDATWDVYFEQAEKYYRENGHLDIPTTYRRNNLHLGKWVYTQRRIRNGETNGFLPASRIHKLNGIGMIWQKRQDMPWLTGIEHAKEYRDAFGNLVVPVEYVAPDGYELGKWISRIRYIERNKTRRGQLSSEKRRQLDELGMVWNRFDLSFEQNFAEAQRYYKRNKNLRVSITAETDGGFPLGRWKSSPISSIKAESPSLRRR